MGNLSSGPYLNVQTLAEQSCHTTQSLGSNSERLFPHHNWPCDALALVFGENHGHCLDDGAVKSHWQGFGHPIPETFEQETKTANQ